MALYASVVVVLAASVGLSSCSTSPPSSPHLERVLAVVYDDDFYLGSDDANGKLNLPWDENTNDFVGSFQHLGDDKFLHNDLIMDYGTNFTLNTRGISELNLKYNIVPKYLSKKTEEDGFLSHPVQSITDENNRSQPTKKNIKTPRPTDRQGADMTRVDSVSSFRKDRGIDLGLQSLLLLLAGTFKLRLLALHRDDVSSRTFKWPSEAAVVGILGAGACGRLQETILDLSRKQRTPVVWLAPFPCTALLSECGTRRKATAEWKTLTGQTSEKISRSSWCSRGTTLPLYVGKGKSLLRCTHWALRHWLARVVPHRPYPLTLENDFRRCLERKLSVTNFSSSFSNSFRASSILPKSSDKAQATAASRMDVLSEDATIDEAQLEEGRRYLDGRTLTIVTINRPPFVILTMGGKEQKEIIGATGFCIEMLKQLSDKYNFTYNLVLPYDGNWGSPMENGTFNGMVGMVNRTEVDFAVASFTITEVRERAIDFTHAYYEEPTTILIPSPKERTNIIAFLAPFSWQVWLCIAGSVFVVTPVLWFLTAQFPSLPVLYPHQRIKQRPSVYRYFWSCVFSLTTQDTEMIETEPTRLLHGMWWIFSIIIIYSYTGNLIAFLTVPKLENLVNSLEELSLQREVLWTYRKNTAHDVLFGFAKPPGTYHRIGNLLTERPELKVNTDAEGINSVLKKNMAFIKEKSWLDFAMEKDYLHTGECRFSQVPQIFFSAGFGWCLQTKSPYLPLVNREILRMTQSGLFAKWRLMFWPRPNECTAGGRGRNVKPMQLWNFTGHFLLLGLGCVISFLVLLLERFLFRFFHEEDDCVVPGKLQHLGDRRPSSSGNLLLQTL
ncbi:glutamate receptor ionotropic, delta-2-like isoform X2 [Oratosquilla oratoria]|uniref:glutamate receptor ionotropic, delta-2-like isoform X2 n=1 Tax=Oratosquilla oratoria TaxID=337810 RepID=UPI003F766905